MKKNQNFKLVGPLLLGSMLALVSCGSDSNGGGGRQEQQQQTEGRYRVTLSPINEQFANDLSGEGDMVIEGDEFSVNLKVNGAPSGMHMQHIHTGRSCPTMDADANEDGIVDAVEAQDAAGRILIPFNGNLSSQDQGQGIYPWGRSYTYNKNATLSRMLADLRADDQNQEDSLAKLDTDEELNLAGRVVIIHGVGSSQNFPATVQSIDGKPAYQTIPIACGVIERVAEEAEADENGANGENGDGAGATDPQGDNGQGGTLDRIGDDIQDTIENL
jgi:hypothetical protein